MQEEHRRILREALLGKAEKRPSFLEMRDIRADSIFDRAKDKGDDGGVEEFPAGEPLKALAGWPA